LLQGQRHIVRDGNSAGGGQDSTMPDNVSSNRLWMMYKINQKKSGLDGDAEQGNLEGGGVQASQEEAGDDDDEEDAPEGSLKSLLSMYNDK